MIQRWGIKPTTQYKSPIRFNKPNRLGKHIREAFGFGRFSCIPTIFCANIYIIAFYFQVNSYIIAKDNARVVERSEKNEWRAKQKIIFLCLLPHVADYHNFNER